jgi:predicted lipoprotein with Yx(FWY)xxD motif
MPKIFYQEEAVVKNSRVSKVVPVFSFGLILVLSACAGSVATEAPPEVVEEIRPASDSEATEIQSPLVLLGGNADLGTFLTDANGMTLYTWARDELGITNCYDQCAVNWPPLLDESGLRDPRAGDGVTGELSTTEREDGTFQVTYDGWPLYFWINDESTGDATGHNVGGTWAVARPTTPLANLGGNEELGSFLIGPSGMTLYTWASDEVGISNCYDQCAEAWPPLFLEDGVEITAGAGAPGALSVAERTDGRKVVTYDGLPLYYWVNDEKPGDSTGHLVGNTWAVARPTLPPVQFGGNEDLGAFLTGNDGMTLYTWANDEVGVTNCYDGCADNWPPLILEERQALTAGAGAPGELGFTERADGSMQVTYYGWPLYFWINDSQPGDATGHLVGGTWAVARPLTPTVNLGSTGDLGTFLTGASGMTLYMFTDDTEGLSTCYDQCAVNWPPLLLGEREALTASAGINGELGVTERSDGGLQVTYNGMPLYFWANDSNPGDTTGHEVGGVWFVVQP